jgi:hypothetical protein
MQQLKAIGIGGYRSLSTDPLAYFEPLGKVNLIAGQNNAGKSNVLRFIHAALLGSEGSEDTVTSGDWDRPLGDGEHRYRLAIGVEVDGLLIDRGGTRNPADDRAFELLREILNVPALIRTEDVSANLRWFVYSSDTLSGVRGWSLDPQFRDAVISSATPDQITRGSLFAQSWFNSYGGNRGDDLWRAIEWLAPDRNALPFARTIVAFRQIVANQSISGDRLDGANLITKLRALQSPALNQWKDRERFTAIERFVRSVLEDDSVTLDIPHDLSSILVTREGATLPLENLGTGVHEVVIIAAAATIIEDSVVCIEEPEIHLHPVLQRKLLAYLAAETSNQYFIATHSAHMLDSDKGSIFHLRLGATGTEVTYAGLPKDRAALCADLGYRPSDLVQANSVLWVEGPSDRIYLRRWIRALDPGLLEGTHYSIMFYGGRLLSHLTSYDPEVNDFLSLRALNRFMMVMMDSDKTSAHSAIGATKKRIRTEFDGSGPGFGWITKCNTIENYVDGALLTDALKATNPTRKTIPAAAAGQWVNPLAKGRVKFDPDKVKLAHEVTKKWDESTWPYDLRDRVRQTVRLVREANGLDV